MLDLRTEISRIISPLSETEEANQMAASEVDKSC